MSGAGSTLLGVVLAGGESRRFGSPKALATFRGEPLWRRAARSLREAGLTPLVLANDTEVREAVAEEGGDAAPDPGPADIRPDARPGRGPLAGVETGLIEARERGLAGALTLACDLVLVDAAMLAALVEAWPGTGAAAFETAGPWGLNPVCSVWGLDLLPEVTGALDDGRGSPGDLLLSVPHVVADLRSVAPGADPGRVLRGVNRPADLADLQSGASGA